MLCPLCGTILLNSMVSMPAISALCLSMGVWSPSPFWAGTCSRVFLQLHDGRVNSTSILSMHNVIIMFRRVVSTPGLHWFSAYLELSLYIIIEPTRSQVRALYNTKGCAGGEGPRSCHEAGGSKPTGSTHVLSVEKHVGGSTQGIARRSCETKRHCKLADEPGLSGRSSSRSGQDEFSIGFSAPSITWNLIACAARVVIIFLNSRLFGEQNIWDCLAS